jgi:hypothetical protein
MRSAQEQFLHRSQSQHQRSRITYIVTALAGGGGRMMVVPGKVMVLAGKTTIVVLKVPGKVMVLAAHVVGIVVTAQTQLQALETWASL